MNKLCNSCKIDKPLEAFSVQARGKFGRRPKCKSCISNEYFQNREKIRQQQALARRLRPEHFRKLRRESYHRCGISDDKRLRQNEYKNTRGRCRANAREALRRATKLKATPTWADLKKITEIYLNCPKGFHVDHIIPLKGRNVSGLHVEYNLQYLPAVENIRKGNRVTDNGRVFK